MENIITKDKTSLGARYDKENKKVEYNREDVDNNGIVDDADAMNILKSLVNLVTLPIA